MRILSEVSRDGELLLAPQIAAQLGERVVISSGSADGGPPEFFLVVEVGRLSAK